jgi:diadenosine tetraphosphate (Ap4A) HIT family hydrolase
MKVTSNDCVFCRVVSGEVDARRHFETPEYLCIEDQYPVTEGHSLLLPKAHIEGLADADWGSLTAALDRAIEAVRGSTTPDGLNVGVNDGAAAGQTVPHLHWHIIPRYEGDVENPAGGVRGVIPEKQKY